MFAGSFDACLALMACTAAVTLSVPAPAHAKKTVRASSFAYPADVVAYEKCWAEHHSEDYCLTVGDNGVGLWGDLTTSTSKAICALPPEDWEAKWGRGSRARGKKLRVTYQGRSIVCELRDSMFPIPKENGSELDLNPGAAKALGLTPPLLVDNVTWEWL